MNKKSLLFIVNKSEINENIKYTNRLFYHRFGAKKSPINSTTVSKKIQTVKNESNINSLNAPEKSHSVLTGKINGKLLLRDNLEIDFKTILSTKKKIPKLY